MLRRQRTEADDWIVAGNDRTLSASDLGGSGQADHPHVENDTRVLMLGVSHTAGDESGPQLVCL